MRHPREKEILKKVSENKKMFSGEMNSNRNGNGTGNGKE